MIKNFFNSMTITVVIFIFLISCQQINQSGNADNKTATSNSDPKAFGSPITLSIGPLGGTISSSDGRLTVTVPAGALADSTPISVQPYINDNTNDGNLGLIYDLLPEGRVFLQPVTITFSYTDEELNGASTDSLGVIFQDTDAGWVWVDNPVIDDTAKTVTVTTSHFCKWQEMTNYGFTLIPGVGTSVKTGNTLNFKIVFACKNPIPAAVITNWAVSDIPGGNSTVGTISSSTPKSAIYTAPSVKPVPNYVYVSVNLAIGPKTTKLMRCIYIFDTPSYFGKMNFHGSRINKNGDTDIWEGFAILYFNQTKDTSTATYYDVDPINSNVIFHSYASIRTDRSGHLLSPTGYAAKPFSLVGTLLVTKTIDCYNFGMTAASASGKIKWMYKSGNPPTTEDIIPLTYLTSSPGGGDPGFVPMPMMTETHLKNSINYSVIDPNESYKLYNDWDFQKVE